MNHTLRSAAHADLTDILRLVRGLAEYERLAHEFTATETEFDALLFGPDRVAEAILAGTPAHPPAGIALFYRTVNTFKGRTGLFLEDLFVEPAHRGTGMGKALLRRLARIAVERGHTSIEWRVLNWNEPSIRFYEALGATKMTDWHVRQLRGPALAALAEGDTAHG